MSNRNEYIQNPAFIKEKLLLMIEKGVFHISADDIAYKVNTLEDGTNLYDGKTFNILHSLVLKFAELTNKAYEDMENCFDNTQCFLLIDEHLFEFFDMIGQGSFSAIYVVPKEEHEERLDDMEPVTFKELEENLEWVLSHQKEIEAIHRAGREAERLVETIDNLSNTLKKLDISIGAGTTFHAEALKQEVAGLSSQASLSLEELRQRIK